MVASRDADLVLHEEADQLLARHEPDWLPVGPGGLHARSGREVVNRVFSQLRIPTSRDLARWNLRVKTELPADLVEQWNTERNAGQGPAFYDQSHRDIPTSMLLSAGLRSDVTRQELLWLLPRLRRDLAGRDAPLVVEVGCGSGVAAAIVSLALGVRVVAVDMSARAVEVAAQVGARTGADIDARVGSASSLADVLGGARADAVFLFSTMRYVQRHAHESGPPVFSFVCQFEHQIASAEPSDDLGALVAALAPEGTLYYSDPSICPDRLPEVEGCLAALGRHLTLSDRRLVTGVVTGTSETHEVVTSRPGTPAPAPADFLTLLAGQPQPLRPGLHLEGAEAEQARRHADLAVVRSCEMTLPDGRVRRAEMSESARFVVAYHAGTDAYCDLDVFPTKHRAKTLSDFDTPVEGITERQITESALDW